MATQQASTEPLRPESHPMTEPARPATAHSAGRADALAVPGIQVDGASDDERQPRSLTAVPGVQPSRGNSPNAHAMYPHTQVTYDDPDFRRPPPLGYTLRTRRKAIFWFWTLIFIDCILMPIGMYFGMWYGLTREQLSANAVFSISTSRGCGGKTRIAGSLARRDIMSVLNGHSWGLGLIDGSSIGSTGTCPSDGSSS
jgi:hypothetical protein